jgi:hypothetical protein
VIQDCIEKFSKEYVEWYKTIPQQIEKIKREIELENEANRVMKNADEELKKRNEQIMYDLKYKKYVR